MQVSNENLNSNAKVIVALDFPKIELAEKLVNNLSPELCKLKVGKELFTLAGPSFVEKLVQKGFDVFLDLKFHDIPNTVAAACLVAADLGVWMINVHASGGRGMKESAREALDKKGGDKPLLTAVTLLTSLDESDIADIGFSGSPEVNVERLALLAKSAGLDGVVCSPKEVSLLRKVCGDDFILVTPGIRLAGSNKGDQKRVSLPVDAMRAGSHYLVIGRSITQANDPCEVLMAVNKDIQSLT
jgi:orotidine-5'-phosphate decarboxylase